jgi:hypothetical protein
VTGLLAVHRWLRQRKGSNHLCSRKKANDVPILSADLQGVCNFGLMNFAWSHILHIWFYR